VLGFAQSRSYPLSLALLLVAGMANLASQSIGQTLVQLFAPPEKRGRVLGVYQMANSGLKAGSGITVGVVGGLIGIHASLSVSAIILSLAVVGLLIYTTRVTTTIRAQPATPLHHAS
jgi:hypothetical protein